MGVFCIFLIISLLYLVGARLFNLVSIEIRISIDTNWCFLLILIHISIRTICYFIHKV